MIMRFAAIILPIAVSGLRIRSEPIVEVAEPEPLAAPNQELSEESQVPVSSDESAPVEGSAQ